MPATPDVRCAAPPTSRWSTRPKEPQRGELYAVTMERSRATASLAIVQAYRCDGDLRCRYGFKAPGLSAALRWPFTDDGWRQKCAGRIIGAMRPTWQAARSAQR